MGLLFLPLAQARQLCPASSSAEVRDTEIKQCHERREKIRGDFRNRISAAHANYARVANARTTVARSNPGADCQSLVQNLTSSNDAGQVTMNAALENLQQLDREIRAQGEHFERQLRKIRQANAASLLMPNVTSPALRLTQILREHEEAIRREIAPFRSLIESSIRGGQDSQTALTELNQRVAADGAACNSLSSIAIDGSRVGSLPPEVAAGEAGAMPGAPTAVDPTIDPAVARGANGSPAADDSSSGSILPWAIGGGALLGGGAYLYFSREARAEDDVKAQREWGSQLEEAAKRDFEKLKSTPIPVLTIPNNTTIVSSDENATIYSALEVPAREFSPLEIVFAPKGNEALQIRNLPKGASWDPSAKIFRWLPGASQAGAYEASIEMGKTKQPLRIRVDARPAAEISRQAPPDIYRDGDIGYVFIHGAGGTKDRCADSADLAAYWGSSPVVVAPDEANRKVACYDGRKAVANQAPRVAQQILESNCGLFNKCILITHSMGGLLIEHMFTHARAAATGDPEPALFANAGLYRRVRDKTLFVISLGSAAGGSKVANILQSTKGRSDLQKFAGIITRWVGADNEAYKNLRSDYSSNVVAPMNQDPGVPIFMVAGYSKKTLREGKGIVDVLKIELGDSDAKIFNGETSLATIDYVTDFSSRSDGLVDFRSACGIADASEIGGPGSRASLDQQYQYCAKQQKKPNRYVWFLINSNHFDLTVPTYHCQQSDNPCETRFFDATAGSGFTLDPAIGKRSAVEVLRERLTRNRKQRVQNKIELGF